MDRKNTSLFLEAPKPDVTVRGAMPASGCHSKARSASWSSGSGTGLPKSGAARLRFCQQSSQRHILCWNLTRTQSFPHLGRQHFAVKHAHFDDIERHAQFNVRRQHFRCLQRRHRPRIISIRCVDRDCRLQKLWRKRRRRQRVGKGRQVRVVVSGILDRRLWLGRAARRPMRGARCRWPWG